jgi:hypothetical protein
MLCFFARARYIDMQSILTSYYTLPADMMLPPSVPNLVVPVAVGASHVAFSSVRLEPTWLLLGGAAGTLIATAVQAGVTPPNVSLLQLQRRVAAIQPLIFYADLPATSPYYTAMQVLGPWGVADTTDPTLLAAPSASLLRAVAANWLVGASLGRNSTVGDARQRPVLATTVRWADFGPGDQFFDAAILCAQIGAFPPPDAKTNFYPYEPITLADLTQWSAKVLGPPVAPAPATHTPSSTVVTRGSGANFVYTNYIRPHTSAHF